MKEIIYKTCLRKHLMRDLYQKENLLRWTTYLKEDNTAICNYASFRKPI